MANEKATNIVAKDGAEKILHVIMKDGAGFTYREDKFTLEMDGNLLIVKSGRSHDIVLIVNKDEIKTVFVVSTLVLSNAGGKVKWEKAEGQ